MAWKPSEDEIIDKAKYEELKMHYG